MTLACNPELTLLTNMAASSPIVGGTSMALAESCVMIGSEGGKILRCHPRKKNIKKLFAGSDSNIHWDKSAIDFFDNLPPCITSKLIKHVELWANSVSRQVVSAKDIFVSKPPLRYVFPAPTGVTEYFNVSISPPRIFVCWRRWLRKTVVDDAATCSNDHARYKLYSPC